MAEIDPKKRQELEDLIELLGSIKGRHTELVTVLIPAGANINATTRQLEGEKSTASNIKSTSTRKNVISALDTIIRELKGTQKTPENGLAIYCGNISQKEGDSDIQLWVYEPPKPLNVKIYRCDQKFVIEPLEEMVGVEELFGLLLIDRQQATIGLLEGKRIKVIQKLTSGVPGKVRAGGQSSQRFHRITEGLAKDFYRRVAEEVKNAFFDLGKLKGILIGGPIPTKEDFIDEGHLVTKLKEKVIAMKDMGDVDESGLEELVELSQQDMTEQELVKEKNLLNRFFETLGKNKKLAVYGVDKVKLALERGAAEVVLMTKDVDRDLEKEIEAMAVNTGAEFVIVTKDHQDGDQFWNLTKGIGALLRFGLE